MMNAGALRHVASIESEGLTSDGAGGSTSAWTEFASVRVAIEPLNGRELFAAQQTQSRVSHRVTLRYDASKVPTTAMRVNFGGRLLYIEAVLNPEERNVWLELLCEERAQA